MYTKLCCDLQIESTCGWRRWQAEEDYLNALNSNKRRQYVGINMEDDNMNNGAFNVGRKYYIRHHVYSNSKEDDSKEHSGDDSDCGESHDESHQGTKPLPAVTSQQTSSSTPSSSGTRLDSETPYSAVFTSTESQHIVVVSTTAAPIALTTSQTKQPDGLSIATEIPVSTETPVPVKVSTSTLTGTEIQQPVEVFTTAAATLETLKPAEFSTEAAESINVPTSMLTSTKTHQPDDGFTSAAPTSETVQFAVDSTTIMLLEPETEQLFEGSTSESPSAATTSRAQPVEASTTTPLVLTSTETLPLWKLIQRRKQQVKEILRKPVTY